MRVRAYTAQVCVRVNGISFLTDLWGQVRSRGKEEEKKKT